MLSNSDAAYQKIKNAVYAVLARRSHTAAELERKLATKGFAQTLIAAAVVEFSELGLINDTQFTIDYIELKKSKGYGPLKIKQALLERGVSQDLIADKLNIADNDFWQDALVAVWQKKFRCKLPQSSKEKSRQIRFLQSRGFTYDQIQCVIR